MSRAATRLAGPTARAQHPLASARRGEVAADTVERFQAAGLSLVFVVEMSKANWLVIGVVGSSASR
jgi:hypothetical protein